MGRSRRPLPAPQPRRAAGDSRTRKEGGMVRGFVLVRLVPGFEANVASH